MKPVKTYPNQKLINGQWGYTYDQKKRIMFGGYSADGVNFTHTFTVNQVEKKDVMFAVALMGLKFGKTQEVMTSYSELVCDEDYVMRMIRYDVELHNK